MWKAYGGREVLRGIDMTVARGEVVTIMGPSGSGKSTLLRMVNHLEALDRGEVLVAGKHVGYRKVDGVLRPMRDLARARAEARIGMVFQHFNLFDHLTALENVTEAPIRVHGQDPERAREIGMGLLARSVSSTTPTTCRTGSPAASSSASRSRGRSPSRRG